MLATLLGSIIVYQNVIYVGLAKFINILAKRLVNILLESARYVYYTRESY
jgi:hypothetical protein